MENKNIIIILIVIIVILAAAIGFALLNPMHAKEPTKIKITSDKEQYEGGELSIQLTDLNKTPLSKEVVNITITNSKGKVVFDNVEKTDSKGKAKIDLDLKKGKYNVTVSYGGNENYTGNTTTQKLTIKEEEKVTQTEDTYYQNTQKLEFNGKTHEQNVQDAKNSRFKGGQWEGASDAEIEAAVSKIERDGGMV
ncbi:MAG: hypothetical protein E7Z83_02795 [Methanobrevibacter sp.]|nr:hypothetical protein [Methanobrevibacter sp.]MBE6489768.1 hypothetical protein [Methanobrevibacter sp.]